MSSEQRARVPADLDERKPIAETPCTSHGDYKHVATDDLPRTGKDPCPQCFPDGEIPDDVDWVLRPRRGDYLHKSREDGKASHPSHDGGRQDISQLLAREDVQSIADAREADL
jgi:hypothetical protein